MGMTWEDRLTKVVLPALVDGTFIYTGFGELHPGSGITLTETAKAQEAGMAKPAGLPDWQCYLGQKPTQPPIRFMQFIHKVRNPIGSAVQVYARGAADRELGVPLTLPLGEGLETPSHELDLHRNLLALILYRPVKIIGLGRSRFYTTNGKTPYAEPIIMEVYSELGDLLWTNPYIGMTLEDAIADLKRASVFRTPVAAPPAPIAVLPPPAPEEKFVPFVTPAMGPAEASTQFVADKRKAFESDIRLFLAQGMPEDEIRAQLARSRGCDIKVANRMYDDFRKRNEPSQEIQTIVRHFASEFDGLYEGDEY